MKKQLALILLLATQSCVIQTKEKPLKSKLIALVDGLSIGIDGPTIGLMLKVRKQIKDLQIGSLDKERGRIGKYHFEGKLHSIRELAQLENQWEQEYLQANDKTLFEKRLQSAHPILVQARKDYELLVIDFLELARGTKDIMVQLIEECCKNRNKPENCLLRDWSHTKEGDEIDSFHNNVTSFRIFDTFCTDIIDFLEDLINSCPKALAQFKKRVAKAQNN